VQSRAGTKWKIKNRIQNTEYGIYRTISKYRTQNTEYRMGQNHRISQNTEYGTQNRSQPLCKALKEALYLKFSFGVIVDRLLEADLKSKTF
jgi:hypothetical protein